MPMEMSRMAKDHGLRLHSVDDAFTTMGSGVKRCVFTTDDISEEFFDLSSGLAGDIFQKLMNYRHQIAIVIPVDHNYGKRITELAREHAMHPVIRFFKSIDETLDWQG
jgi:hypothetical protein